MIWTFEEVERVRVYVLLLLLDRRGEVGKRHLDRSNSYLVVLDR